jgi:hypothetical protein
VNNTDRLTVTAGADQGTGPAPDDPVVRELLWIDRQLAKPIVLPSPTAVYRRARLRYHRARLEKLL